MNIFEPFPMAEEYLRLFFLEQFPVDLADNRVGVEFPGDLATRLPYVRIEMIGGARSRLVDFPEVDVETFAATRYAAELLGERLSAALLGFPFTVILPNGDRVTVDYVAQVSPPSLLPWEDTNIRRFGQTVSLVVRR